MSHRLEDVRGIYAQLERHGIKHREEGPMSILPEVAVKNGLVWLDRTMPGWEGRIRKALNMNDCTMCVLGQVFGDFYWVIYWMMTAVDPGDDAYSQDAYDWAAEHGFWVDEDYSIGYPALTTLWRAALQERGIDA